MDVMRKINFTDPNDKLSREEVENSLMRICSMLNRKQANYVAKFILANREELYLPEFLKYLGMHLDAKDVQSNSQWFDEYRTELYNKILRKHNSLDVLKKEFEK